MEEKIRATEETKKSNTARYTLRWDVNDESQYEAVCYMERKHQTTGMTYNDIILEALLYWFEMFRCDEYPENVNRVAMYFEEANELKLKTRKALIRNPEYVPDITEDDVLQKYLDKVNVLPKLQIEE